MKFIASERVAESVEFTVALEFRLLFSDWTTAQADAVPFNNDVLSEEVVSN